MDEENKEQKETDENVSRETIDFESKYNELKEQHEKDTKKIEQLTKERDEANSTMLSFQTKKGEETPNEFEQIFGRLKV